MGEREGNSPPLLPRASPSEAVERRSETRRGGRGGTASSSSSSAMGTHLLSGLPLQGCRRPRLRPSPIQPTKQPTEEGRREIGTWKKRKKRRVCKSPVSAPLSCSVLPSSPTKGEGGRKKETTYRSEGGRKEEKRKKKRGKRRYVPLVQETFFFFLWMGKGLPTPLFFLRQPANRSHQPSNLPPPKLAKPPPPIFFFLSSFFRTLARLIFFPLFFFQFWFRS